MIEELIRNNEKLIYSIINKYNYYFEIEDLYQVAIVGLINAYKNYNQDKETKFSTYAYFYILGEVNNYIRESNYFKISKESIKLNKLIERARAILTQKLNKEPNNFEISLFLNIDIQKIEEVKDATSLLESLDNYEEEVNLYNYISYKEQAYEEEILDLKLAIDKLNNFEKKIIENRYTKGYTQSETSNLLGINQVKVYRLEKEILTKLRKNLSS